MGSHPKRFQLSLINTCIFAGNNSSICSDLLHFRVQLHNHGRYQYTIDVNILFVYLTYSHSPTNNRACKPNLHIPLYANTFFCRVIQCIVNKMQKKDPKKKRAHRPLH